MNARAAKPTPGLALGAEPRANLLPPEVLERARARRTRRWLALLVVVVLLATAGGYAFVSLQAMTAQDQLAAAQTRTSELLQEKSTYADVIAASSALTLITSTQQQATSNEIMWADLLADMLKAIPGRVLSVNKVNSTAPAPWESPLLVTGALRQPRVATFEIRYGTPTPPEATQLYRAFLAIDGVSDMSLDAVEWSKETELYFATITINLDVDALSERWKDDAEDDADDAAEDAATEEEATDEGQ